MIVHRYAGGEKIGEYTGIMKAADMVDHLLRRRICRRLILVIGNLGIVI